MKSYRILSAFLYSYPVSLCVLLLFCNLFSHRRQAADRAIFLNSGRSKTLLSVVWYLQAILSTTVVFRSIYVFYCQN